MRPNLLFSAVPEPAEGLAHIYPFRPGGSGDSAGFQRSGKRSAIRRLGCVLTRSITSRRYANGSTLRLLHVAVKLIQVAAVRPPLSLPQNSQFFRPTAIGRIAFSLALLVTV
jgi:hypothetical protein